MRRGVRGNWNRPLHRSYGERPRGLRGKDIGLYYRDRQRMSKNQNKVIAFYSTHMIASMNQTRQ